MFCILSIVYSDADGYSSVKNSRPSELVYPKPDGFSSAKESRAKVTGKAAKKPESLANDNAVVNRDGQRRPDRSDEYNHINQQPTKVPCDVSAQVDKSSKRRVQGSLPNSQDVRPAKTEPEIYAHGQKPIPSTKPKSPVEPKPNALSDHEEGQSQHQPEVTQEALKEDDYNILSHQPTSRDPDPQYSHIRDV